MYSIPFPNPIRFLLPDRPSQTCAYRQAGNPHTHYDDQAGYLCAIVLMKYIIATASPKVNAIKKSPWQVSWTVPSPPPWIRLVKEEQTSVRQRITAVHILTPPGAYVIIILYYTIFCIILYFVLYYILYYTTISCALAHMESKVETVSFCFDIIP